MSANIVNTLYLSLAFGALFASAEYFYHKRKVEAEYTRKYVHIVTGLLTLLFPALVQNHWLVLGLCTSFLVILLLSLRLELLPSINAVGRQTMGSILYPIIVYSCYLVFQKYDQFMFFYIPILILAICDPVAALIGRKWPKGQYKTFGHTKTMSGSLAFFAVAVAICMALMVGVEEIPFQVALFVAVSVGVFTTIAEAYTHKGFDNLSIPLVAVLVLIFFEKMQYI